MKTRPILMSGPLVRALLEGRKTQTRRPIKGINPTLLRFNPSSAHIQYGIRCPYGQPGDLLWVRETWASNEQAGVNPDYSYVVYRATDPDWAESEGWSWKPSIFMPRWASRITLRLTDVGVERLHDISDADAVAEGWPGFDEQPFDAPSWFEEKWRQIYGVQSWDANPWVWALSFDIERENVDEILKEVA